jgi:hypothetical protein
LKSKDCPNCGNPGKGSVHLKRTSNGKGKWYSYYWCAHYLIGNKVKWHYIGKSLPNKAHRKQKK